MRDLICLTVSFNILHFAGWQVWLGCLPLIFLFCLWPVLPKRQPRVSASKYARIGRPWGVGGPRQNRRRA